MIRAPSRSNLRIFSQHKSSQVNIGRITFRSGAEPEKVTQKLGFLLPNYVKVLGCISFLFFDKVVRYGASCLNPGYEAENEAPPNAPYATFLQI